MPRPDVASVRLELPWPISLNAYHVPVNGRIVLSAAGRRYREVVTSLIRGAGRVSGPVVLIIDFYPPDHRRRDVDNLFKVLLDSLKNAVMEDDSQVKVIHAYMREPVPPAGMVYLVIEKER